MSQREDMSASEGQANMPYQISQEMWVLLAGHLFILVITVLRSYFGGFRELWREQPPQPPSRRTTGLSGAELGQMMLWKGEMNHGACSFVLLWVVLPALHTGMINPLGVDILFVYHAAWLGSKLAFLGPLASAALSLVLEPRTWLTAGLVLTSWDLASWQSQGACLVLPLYGLWVNAFQYPQTVFGVRSRCSWCSHEWTLHRYRSAARKIRDPAPRTSWQRVRAKFPTYLERERVVLLILEHFECLARFTSDDSPRESPRTETDSPARLDSSMTTSGGWRAAWPRRLAAVLIPAIITGVLVAGVVMAERARQQWHLQRGVCQEVTGGGCTVFGCDSYRNAICNRSDWSIFGDCVCASGFCAVDGMCVPRPNVEAATALWPRSDAAVTDDRMKAPFKALVFSGGGAKGAWEVGVIKALCDPASAVHAVFGLNWTMLVGTSIGALNAGFLAQFAPEDQCTLGLEALTRYWESVIDQEDVFESPSPWHFKNFDHTNCFRISEAPAIFNAFSEHGGFCNPAPGEYVYSFEVQPELIRTSGMQLRVVATSLNTSQAKWWNEGSDDVLDGILASGALAPLVYPKRIGDELYIDGGLCANAPVLKAVQEGAQEVLVMLLDPLKVPKLSSKEPLGMAIFEFEIDLFMFKYFVESELERACELGKQRGVRIWGYAPPTDLESMMAFEASQLRRMAHLGFELSNTSAPLDLCHWLAAMKSAQGRRRPARPEALLSAAALPDLPIPGSSLPSAAMLLALAVVAAYAAGSAHGALCRGPLEGRAPPWPADEPAGGFAAFGAAREPPAGRRRGAFRWAARRWGARAPLLSGDAGAG